MTMDKVLDKHNSSFFAATIVTITADIICDHSILFLGSEFKIYFRVFLLLGNLSFFMLNDKQSGTRILEVEQVGNILFWTMMRTF